MAESGQDLRKAYLKEQLTLASKAMEALLQSHRAIQPHLPFSSANTQEFTEKLETMTARFARLVDILTQKVFRAVDALELEDEGSLLDRLNRMEKRRVISSANLWREISDLRNQIAHEYTLEDLMPLYSAVIEKCPEVLSAIERVNSYLKNKHLI